MADQDRYQLLVTNLKKEFPRFHVKLRKKSWLHPIFWLMGKILRRDYSGFTTTVFSGIYTEDNWEKRSAEKKYRTLRHEMIHIRQFHSFPLGHWAWPLNHILMPIAYILLLPAHLTLRSRFERAGYTQTLLVEYELHGKLSDARMESNARWMAETFGGGSYSWMWSRKKAYAWAMRTQHKINSGKIKNDRDRIDELRAA